MLLPLKDLPENVVGFEAHGKVTAADYEQHIMPAIDRAHEKYDKIRFLFHLGPAFESFTAGAVWDDAKVGMMHFAHFEKCAIVTGDTLVSTMIRAFGFIMPGAVKLFPNDELDAAKQWVAS